MPRRDPPEIRSRVIGAWARYLLQHEGLELEVDWEPGIDSGAVSRSMAMLRLRTGEMVSVTAIVPWGRPDPRGPENETARHVWDGHRWVKARRYPMRLTTLVHVADVLDPVILDKHALIAAGRVQRELDRGYAIVGELVAGRQEFVRDRPALPRFTHSGPILRAGEWAAVLDERGLWWHHLTPERAHHVLRDWIGDDTTLAPDVRVVMTAPWSRALNGDA